MHYGRRSACPHGRGCFSLPTPGLACTLQGGPSARVVRPENGMIILFPSYLQHSVRMYNGERPRVCVPFNARLRSVRAQI
jgi:Putative 2OG-Fe(II) oxygenase